MSRPESDKLWGPALLAGAVALGSILLMCHGPSSPPGIARNPFAEQAAPASNPTARTDEITNSLFNDDVPEVRITACEQAGQSRDPKWRWALLVRMTDRDASVRRAASAALQAVQGISPEVQTTDLDTDARVRHVLDLLDAWTADAEERAARPSMCDIWADTSWLGVSPVLAESCLECHAGTRRTAFADNEQCRACHETIHREWAGTAHAQSLLHVHLPTTGATDDETAFVTFGEVRGISCIECHRIAATLPQTEASRCVHAFEDDGCGDAGCTRCHTDTAAEWQQWRSLPAQPQRVPWPPGEVNLAAMDQRGCVDCHMKRIAAPGTPYREHHWSARRNIALLSEAVHVSARIEQADDGGSTFVAVLTNTSGHAFPTGTCRRTIELWIQYPPAGRQPAAVLGEPYPNRPASRTIQSPLAPGERRTIRHALPTGTASAGYVLRYVRDRLNPALYTADIHTGRTPGAFWADTGTNP